MKERNIGIDAGTNSIGWSIVDYDSELTENQYTLIDKGVNIFQEGVKLDKGNEKSKAAERTDYKQTRVRYWRRKIRKIRLLKLLMKHGLCPVLTDEELKAWRSDKVYPQNEAFMEWQRTSEEENKNPYYDRYLCLSQKLDLSDVLNRYRLGRALYHLNQRRGFLSNRKENTKESEGTVKKGIDALTAAMQESGVEYLGQYFFQLYQRREKIRLHYTSRIEHYQKELQAICSRQGLSDELTQDLCKVILTQRPLKSQKHNVGKCVFEPNKSRCPASHPLFEQYRMYAFINNIKMQGPADSKLRELTAEEKSHIIPLFLRKSKKDFKKNFKFEDIAKKLAGGKNNFCYYKDTPEKAYRFNYHMDTTVSGCPVIAQLSEVFDVKADIDGWLDAACEVYTQGGGKNRFEIMNDIWHALFFFDDEGKLKVFAEEKLQLDEAHAVQFSKIRLPADYASLSLKAIRKILPYMKQYGMIYSHAVFLANLPGVIGCPTDEEALLPMLPREDAEDIVSAFYEFDPSMSALHSREEYVKRYVVHKYHLDEVQERKLKGLYHPSMIETFPKVRQRTAGGYYQLGSPRTSSLRNPMAMHSLFRLRHVINTLLREGKIDEDTTVRIEFSRDLNDHNRRVAIKQWQVRLEKKKAEASKRIREHFGNDYVPTETDLLKYKLWEEQEHICLYTGKSIGLEDLFNPMAFDIEHTVPRSVGGDSTDMNLTLCDSHFNRDVKKAQLPSQLANHEEILERIAGWKSKLKALEKEIRKINTRGIYDKETKDSLIQKRHLKMLEYDYWQGKYERFVMKEVPEGFSRRQGVDIGIISRYARLYLKSLFRRVQVVKGVVTADFRKIWGLQEEYEKKERVNHAHHVIDAITIACIGRAEYDRLAQYYHDEERCRWGLESRRAVFPKPWKTFTEDVKQIDRTLLVSHYTADNLRKRTRKKVRINGKLTEKYMEGDTARGPLHLATYYGAIRRKGEIRYVVRKAVGDAVPEQIVDDVVREKVKAAVNEHGDLKKAVEAGIWMNKEKGIRINKVRVYASQVKRPLAIGRQRDVRKDYKSRFYVKNDSNYLMAIYVGTDEKGKEKRSFKLVNNLEAVKFYQSARSGAGAGLVPAVDEKGYALKWQLKPGSMVLLYEETPEELYHLDARALSRRLYKITGMSFSVISGLNYGTLDMIFHQEARPSADVRFKNGKYTSAEELRPGIALLHTQFRGLVQGQDFEMNEIGEIRFLNK